MRWEVDLGKVLQLVLGATFGFVLVLTGRAPELGASLLGIALGYTAGNGRQAAKVADPVPMVRRVPTPSQHPGRRASDEGPASPSSVPGPARADDTPDGLAP